MAGAAQPRRSARRTSPSPSRHVAVDTLTSYDKEPLSWRAALDCCGHFADSFGPSSLGVARLRSSIPCRGSPAGLLCSECATSAICDRLWRPREPRGLEYPLSRWATGERRWCGADSTSAVRQEVLRDTPQRAHRRAVDDGSNDVLRSKGSSCEVESPCCAPSRSWPPRR